MRVREFFLNTFSPATLFTWPVFAVSLGWAGTAHLLDAINNHVGFYPLRALILLAVHVAAFGLLWFAVAGMKRLSPLVAAVSTVPVVLLVAMTRGALFSTLLLATGLDVVPVIAYRVFGSITAVGLPILITSLVVKKIRDFQATRNQLLNETARLEKVLLEARAHMERETLERSTAIRATLLGSLKLWETKSAEDTIDTLRGTMDDIVRPLSHRLDAEDSPWRPDEQTSEPGRVDWKEAFAGAFGAHHLHPAAVGVGLMVFGLPNIVQNYSWQASAYLLTVALLVPWLGLTGVRALLRRLENSRRLLLPPVFALGAIATGFLVGWASLLATATSEAPYSFVIYGPIYLLAFASVFALATSASEQARVANERLAEATAQLAWEVARVSEEYRHARQRLSKALHGRVQAGMMASLLKLRTAVDAEDPRLDTLTRQTAEELEKLIASIDANEGSDVPNLERTLQEVSDTWEGVARIRLVTPGNERDFLASDPVVSRTLADLLPELAFNAIRHGDATEVSFSLEPEAGAILRVICVDNGTRKPEAGRIGLGTKLLDDCALHWRRSTVDNRTVTDIALPLSLPETAAV